MVYIFRIMKTMQESNVLMIL